MRRFVIITGMVVAGLLGAAGSASGLTCAEPVGPRFASGDVALEGVALRGATNGRDLVSPARVLVSSYLKGDGPAVVRVTTGVFDGGAIGGAFAPAAGDTVRVVGDRSRDGAGYSRSGPVPRGTIVTSFCDRDTQVRAHAREPWRAEAERVLLLARGLGGLLGLAAA